MGTVPLSILEQRLKPENIFVYDDGSTDHTVEVIEDLQKQHQNLYLLRTDPHAPDISRLPANFNHLFRYAERLGLRNTAYELITADDVILYPDYCQKLIDFMQENSDYAIVSGVGTTDGFMKAPRGIRMIRKAMYDHSLFNGYWAENPSFESALLYEAMRQGYKVKALNEVKFIHLRPTGKHHSYKTFGRAMRALNYSKLYVFARLAVNFISGKDYPRSKTWNILFAYLTYGPVEPYPQEFIRFIHKRQHEDMIKAFKMFIMNRL